VVSAATLGSPCILSQQLSCRWVHCKLDSTSRCTGLVGGERGKVLEAHLSIQTNPLNEKKRWRVQSGFRGKIQ